MAKKNHSNVAVQVGISYYECEHCGGTSKVVLTYEQVAKIRAAGGGAALAQCLTHDHDHTVKFAVWNPSQGAD